MDTEDTVLVLGATGGIGGELVRQLRDGGWSVRAMARKPASADAQDGVTWIQGDALKRAEVESAAAGCSVIIHAVNPPGYRNWAGVVLPMLDNTLAAARKARATVVLPGTVYNFGPDAFPLLNEGSPQRPLTRKGAIRAEMEQRLLDYATSGGRALIVRAGDFFGPRAGNNWFAQGLLRPGRIPRRVHNPGRTGIGHQWSYLPDVARAVVLLLQRRESLDSFACFHMAGHWDADGAQMIAAIRRTLARYTGREPGIASFPWWLIRLLALFQETCRELLEMRYLWQQPVQMDNAKLVATLGREPHTPLDQAVEETLRSLQCLPPRKPGYSVAGNAHRNSVEPQGNR